MDRQWIQSVLVADRRHCQREAVLKKVWVRAAPALGISVAPAESAAPGTKRETKIWKSLHISASGGFCITIQDNIKKILAYLIQEK